MIFLGGVTRESNHVLAFHYVAYNNNKKERKTVEGKKNNDFQRTIKYSVVENEFCVKSVAVCGERTKEAPKECSVYKIK